MIADLFFFLHKIGILIVTFGWVFNKKILYIQAPVIISWYLNDNKCIISQLEYYYFKRTFMGNGPNYYIPRRHRYLLFWNFFAGGCYHFIE